MFWSFLSNAKELISEWVGSPKITYRHTMKIQIFAFVLKKGYRVVYNPESILLRCEGATCGISEESGVKSYQQKQVLFITKWSLQLVNHYEPTGGFLKQYLAANRLNGVKAFW